MYRLLPLIAAVALAAGFTSAKIPGEEVGGLLLIIIGFYALVEFGKAVQEKKGHAINFKQLPDGVEYTVISKDDCVPDVGRIVVAVKGGKPDTQQPLICIHGFPENIGIYSSFVKKSGEVFVNE